MAANVFNARLAQANVITKTDFEANPAGKYWSPGRPEDVSHQRPQDVP